MIYLFSMRGKVKRVQPVGKQGAIAHIVYDLSLPLEERIKKQLHFDSLKEVSKFLGVGETKIGYNRSVGKRIFAKENWWAVRIKKGY